MSKVYLITETQMKSLPERLELTALRKNNILTRSNVDRQEDDDLYRAFVFVIHRWISEMGSDVG